MSQQSTLVCWSGTQRHETALVCVPWAGAGAAPFRAWAALMCGTASVYAARLAGREARFGEPLPVRLGAVVDEVAEAVARLPQARVALFGHCSGAIIAFEVARAMRGVASSTLAHLIVVAQLAPRTLARNPPNVGPEANIPQRLRGEPQFVDMLLPILAADIRMISSYEYLPAEPLNVPITVFRGGRDAVVTRDELAGWREETVQGTDWREVDGADHLFSGDAWLKLGHQVRDRLV